MKTEENTTVAPRPPELFHAAPMAGPLSQRPEIITASASPGPPPEVKVAARKLRVLVVQDDPSDVELVLHALKTGGIQVEREIVQTAEEFTQRIRTNTYEVVLADYSLPGWNGLDTVEILRREGLDIPVIVVSGALGELMAVECIKQGAADYLLKDHLPRSEERRVGKEGRCRG